MSVGQGAHAIGSRRRSPNTVFGSLGKVDFGTHFGPLLAPFGGPGEPLGSILATFGGKGPIDNRFKKIVD